MEKQKTIVPKNTEQNLEFDSQKKFQKDNAKKPAEEKREFNTGNSENFEEVIKNQEKKLGTEEQKKEGNEYLQQKLVAQIASMKEQLEVSKDKYFRLAAEFENYKKRQQQQSELKEKYANETIAKNLFTVIDSLQIALEHIPKEETNKNFEEFIKGIHLVYQQFIDVLKQHNITKFQALGEFFDPNKHDAISTIKTDQMEENKIFAVFKPGYYLHDRVIRPAVVQVAKKD